MDIICIEKETDFGGNLHKIDFVDFLYEHLEQYGDPKCDIEKAIDYALSDVEGKGGFLLAGYYSNEFAGALIMNKTGMSGYIPENIIVYVAAHKNWRAMGIGFYLIQKAIEMAEGEIALHVEQDNPARKFYEKMEFKSKYVEMRLKTKD